MRPSRRVSAPTMTKVTNGKRPWHDPLPTHSDCSPVYACMHAKLTLYNASRRIRSESNSIAHPGYTADDRRPGAVWSPHIYPLHPGHLPLAGVYS